MNRTLFALACLVVALTGCEKLSPAVLVKDTRIIGGDVSVGGDATRASPMPDEQMNVRFYVAAPVGVSDTLNWAFYSCLQSLSAGGLPRCEGEFSIENLSMGTGAPMFSLVTPTPGELNTGRLVSAAAVALEVTVAVLALVYAMLLL